MVVDPVMLSMRGSTAQTNTKHTVTAVVATPAAIMVGLTHRRWVRSL